MCGRGACDDSCGDDQGLDTYFHTHVTGFAYHLLLVCWRKFQCFSYAFGLRHWTNIAAVALPLVLKGLTVVKFFLGYGTSEIPM